MAREPAGKGAAPPPREDARAPEGSPAPEPPLPDISTLGPGSDYRPFLDRRVAPALRRLALRRLWRSDPRLANLDGLNDYDEDFGALHRRGAEILRAAREAGRRVLARAAGPREAGRGPAPEQERDAGTRDGGVADADQAADEEDGSGRGA